MDPDELDPVSLFDSGDDLFYENDKQVEFAEEEIDQNLDEEITQGNSGMSALQT